MVDIICPECNNKMVNRSNQYGEFIECVDCDIRKYGDGTFADKELRELRMEAHKTFDSWWKIKKIKRYKAYKQLAQDMRIKKDKTHIRFFDKEQCNFIIKLYGKRGAA